MRTVVAVVAARPETIAEDYRRLMDLAGVPGPGTAAGPGTLLAQAGPGGWFPGAGCPPWQIEGVTAALGGPAGPGGGVRIAPVAPRGGAGSADGWCWDHALAAGGVRPVGSGFWAERPWRAPARLPHLRPDDAGRFPVPSGLVETPWLGLLAVPSLERTWHLAGAVRLLVAAILGARRRPRGTTPDDHRVDGLALARDVLAAGDPARTFAVLDGAIWQIGPGHRGRGPVARNLLLAGPDPVAVDAVAVRLSGGDPARVPWLRACAERGLGAARPADIRLAGQTELLDRPFGTPDPSRMVPGPRLPGLADLSWRLLRRPTILRRHRASPWGRLFEEYRAGGNGGTER
jgi:hypothetical protein